MEMEKGLETGNMAHLCDEIAKTWFVKVAMESLKGERCYAPQAELGSLAERAAQLIGLVGTNTEVDEATVREMIKSGRDCREHGPTLTIEIAVRGIKHEIITRRLALGFRETPYAS